MTITGVSRSRSLFQNAFAVGAALSARQRASQAASTGKPARESKLGEALYEVVTGQSIMLMAGLLVIGFVSTLYMDPKGFQPFYDFFQSKGMLFRGALCIFLLEMGLVAGEKLGDLVNEPTKHRRRRRAIVCEPRRQVGQAGKGEQRQASRSAPGDQ